MNIYSSVGLLPGKRKLEVYFKKRMSSFRRTNLNGQNAYVYAQTVQQP
jgi:hypothetical protein